MISEPDEMRGKVLWDGNLEPGARRVAADPSLLRDRECGEDRRKQDEERAVSQVAARAYHLCAVVSNESKSTIKRSEMYVTPPPAAAKHIGCRISRTVILF